MTRSNKAVHFLNQMNQLFGGVIVPSSYTTEMINPKLQLFGVWAIEMASKFDQCVIHAGFPRWEGGSVVRLSFSNLFVKLVSRRRGGQVKSYFQVLFSQSGINRWTLWVAQTLCIRPWPPMLFSEWEWTYANACGCKKNIFWFVAVYARILCHVIAECLKSFMNFNVEKLNSLS